MFQEPLEAQGAFIQASDSNEVYLYRITQCLFHTVLRSVITRTIQPVPATSVS